MLHFIIISKMMLWQEANLPKIFTYHELKVWRLNKNPQYMYMNRYKFIKNINFSVA